MWANFFSHVWDVEEISLIEEISHASILLTFIKVLQDAGSILSTPRVTRIHLFILHIFTDSHGEHLLSV